MLCVWECGLHEAAVCACLTNLVVCAVGKPESLGLLLHALFHEGQHFGLTQGPSSAQAQGDPASSDGGAERGWECQCP